jgi:SRSO17 transposase
VRAAAGQLLDARRAAGKGTPDRIQHLLARAVWDTDAVPDDLRGYVVDHLADPDTELVEDETGDLKKGSATVGVYLVNACAGGHAFSACIAASATAPAPARSSTGHRS